ncbi:hypothetical protein CCDG5_0587 [[Clostridium] cellulosi]|jgi:hypothetical protein|uniref:Uncharacterized protein n=1 Tax=[Clostridium] cellulosi TaxID=29343 RepID=A0A078KMN3_9FIRM|nr:hypothetical protein CCDG5_0587 [[Clostridium] cellulosi]
MAEEAFIPSVEYKKFAEANGEDTFIRMNLLYIAFELNDLYSEENNADGEFDELCEDILDMYLDDQFEGFNVIDIADGAAFIIEDSNYTVHEYVRTYRRNREKICEELLAYLNKQRRLAVEEANQQ